MRMLSTSPLLPQDHHKGISSHLCVVLSLPPPLSDELHRLVCHNDFVRCVLLHRFHPLDAVMLLLFSPAHIGQKPDFDSDKKAASGAAFAASYD
jgi:hypothetical protein